MDSETRATIIGALSYFSSDSRLASFYRVTEQEVARLRALKKPSKQRPIEQTALGTARGDQLEAEAAWRGSEALRKAMVRYYEKRAKQLGCDVVTASAYILHCVPSRSELARIRAMGLGSDSNK